MDVAITRIPMQLETIGGEPIDFPVALVSMAALDALERQKEEVRDAARSCQLNGCEWETAREELVRYRNALAQIAALQVEKPEEPKDNNPETYYYGLQWGRYEAAQIARAAIRGEEGSNVG